MTKYFFAALYFSAAYSSMAQVEDSITMQAGRTHESYYNLNSGEVANVDNMDWDLAFELSGLGSSIRSNGHIGTEVFVYPNGTDWNSVDTTGMQWEALHNSETSWETGAFDQDADPQDPFDTGWGEYNMITHSVTGNRIFIVTLMSGDYKKVVIDSLSGGVFSFRHANLDGSSEVMQTITKGDYVDRNFVYYSVTNDQIIDREPANNSWDLVFTKYMATLAPGVVYNVTGVLSNIGVHVRQADGVDPTVADYNNFAVDSVIDVIGHDWKSFNGVTVSYDITSDLSYFVEDLNGDLWHIVFTRFDLGSSGKTVFSKERISQADVSEIADLQSFGMYPNPTNDFVTIAFNSEGNSTVTITDMNGSILARESMSSSGFHTKTIAVQDFPAGVYLVRISTQNGTATEKLIIN
ncbi:MAG: hypothetical protein DCO96_02740 [Fluviicola sp. XM-24bin1]|nr:MAG: hypothetical protein DCO96_02740 [Fluviicola sp. XM-24bin1]